MSIHPPVHARRLLAVSVFVSLLCTLLVPITLSGCADCNPRSECAPEDAHCEGNVAVSCAIGTEPANPFYGEYHWFRRPCAAPETCVAPTGEAFCALEPEPCDPGTFTPRCLGDRAVVCRQAANNRSGTYPVLDFACPEGNRCMASGAYVGCGHAETRCEPATFVPRCDGATLVTCRGAYGRADAPNSGFEFHQTCTGGCAADAQGVARCSGG